MAFSFFGMKLNAHHLNIVLPVGISFYTFQTMSYSIDVYKNKLKPTKDFFAFSAFVAFFPQLVAGPIERATNLLPQFYTNRTFNYNSAVVGCRQMLWGFFKKIVIADNCAVYANMIFNNSSEYSGSTLVLGVFFFAFQIYGDFSGYSDIAIGISRLFGFNLKQNFAYPYFSRDIAEFWRRWHISLTTWFRDYVYIPMGGSRVNVLITVRNTFIIFLISGFWHGARWTFLIWGLLNAVYFLPLMFFKKNRINLDVPAKGKLLPGFKETVSIVITFSLTSFAWIFFRAENVDHAIKYISRIFSASLFSIPLFYARRNALITFLLTILMVVIEWVGRGEKFALKKLFINQHRAIRWVFYYSLLIMIVISLMSGVPQEFIYFQF
jgi:D-alanyl-lipoteichoic acid acyltransferase DltB (MBOAT superfamily)